MLPRTRTMAVIAVAWATPLAWVTIALAAAPSDGTSISSPTAYFGEARWGETVTVLRAYGETPLEEGDLVLAVDGRTIDDWLSAPDAARSEGDRVTYRVRRPAAELDRILELDVELTRYPLGSALSGNLPVAVLVLGFLLAGSLVYWRRPDDPAALAVLVTSSAVAAGVTAYPLGTSAIDLAGGRGVWPQAVGGVFLIVGAGATVVAAWTFPWVRGWLVGRRVVLLALFLVPWLCVAAWILAVLARGEGQPARLQGFLTMGLPAAAVAGVVVLVAGVEGYLHSPSREDRIALRLLLWVVATAVVVRLLLEDLPRQISGRPLVPGDLLALLLVPLLLVGLVVALLRVRLHEIDAALRRSLVQLIVATMVGAVFLAAAGTADLAADTSFTSMVAGGAVALILLPAALAVRHALISVFYGDREFPYRVVSDLRRLDVGTSPEDALGEMLTVLGRSLRLSFASVEVYAASPADRIETSIGQPSGRPTTVALEAGGVALGALQLEVAPSRDPFGPRDRRLLEDIGTQVGALVQVIRLNRELQRSRESLVAAREEERRRVRRDLHDGLGPSLASMAMNLDLAHDLIRQDPEEAAGLVGRLAEKTRTEIGEVRRLVDGLRPPTVDQLGLVPALRQRADEHNLAIALGDPASTMSWTVDAEGDLDTLPAAVEVAAYWIVVEAVNNALRHSGAGSCAVTLRRDGDSIDIEVTDTGTGLGPDARPGLGLGSMRERAEELGGSFAVGPGAGQGTRVRARLPLVPRVESTR